MRPESNMTTYGLNGELRYTEDTAILDKMQSETAYFAPGAATWRTGRNVYASSSILAQ